MALKKHFASSQSYIFITHSFTRQTEPLNESCRILGQLFLQLKYSVPQKLINKLSTLQMCQKLIFIIS
jgi:hypothetical protein